MNNSDRTNSLMTIGQVEEMCTLKKTTIYALMKSGRFPQQIRLTNRSVRWRRTEILEWRAQKMKTTPEGNFSNPLRGEVTGLAFPLSEDFIRGLAAGLSGKSMVEFARAIEVAHGII